MAHLFIHRGCISSIYMKMFCVSNKPVLRDLIKLWHSGVIECNLQIFVSVDTTWNCNFIIFNFIFQCWGLSILTFLSHFIKFCPKLFLIKKWISNYGTNWLNIVGVILQWLKWFTADWICELTGLVKSE